MMRSALGMMLAFLVSQSLAAAPPAAVLQAEADRVAVIDKVRPTVLAIFAADGGGGGSGVIISPDGYALSNFHVARPAGAAMKCGLSDGSLVDATIVGIDPTGDVALLKLLGRDRFPHAELGNSDQVEVGETVYVMGNPFLLATDFRPTVTCGIISGVHRYQFPAGTLLEYADCLQTDASINPGNSGGPLFNARGELIGINGRGSFEKRGRVNVGVGYSISINQIKNFLGHLHSGRIVDHATLGARVGSDPDGRVIVTDLLEESDAYRRGLRYGDEILKFAGRTITSPNAFKNALGIFPKGWRVPLAYRRQGELHEILIRLSGVHSTAELWAKAAGMPSMPGEPRPEKPPQQPPDEAPPDEAPPHDSPLPHHRRPGVPARGILPGSDPALPDIVKQHFEARPGYANYYFNRLNQERLRKILAAQGDFSTLAGTWVLGGEMLAGGAAEFAIDDQRVGALLPGGQLELRVGDDLSTDLDPPDSGGLLASLHLWRRLLVGGFDAFDEVYYLGTVPWAGSHRLVDVLIAVQAGVECHFFIDADEERLVGLEMFPDDNADPCELQFTEFAELGGRVLPSRLEVRHGDELYAAFKFSDFKLAPKTPK